ncbi:MAG: hypothetical protein IKJ31_04145 [Bacteroidaceae bacterium]|nr:hypothetical protein [Bacteroidaceae bacterium]
MKKIAILGNGFDIDLGLNTRYSDYAKSTYWPFSEGNSKSGLGVELDKASSNSNWFDIEQTLENYSRKFFRQSLPVRYSQGYFNNCIADYHSLVTSLHDYLKNEEAQACINKDSIAAMVLQAIVKNGKYENIYTFNYTDLATIKQKLDLPANTGEKITHVHGSIKENNIIIGFNEQTDVPDDLQCMYKTFSPHYRSNTLRYDIAEADEITIFGHSLSPIDYTYFSDFFVELCRSSKSRKESKRVTIFTYDNASRIEIMRQLRNMNEKSTELLFGLNKFEVICTKDGVTEQVKRFIEYEWQTSSERESILFSHYRQNNNLY